MASEVKKVGIELTAEGAKDFASSMKEVKAATSEAYSELKLAQSQYDKNTSATKKLEDRQKYLSTATDEYKKKLEILNAQLADMESAENRDETAISKKRKEINECKAKINEYERAIKDVNAQLETHSTQLKEWGDKLKGVGDKTQEVGRGLTTHVTAPIAGAAAGAVAGWKEVDEAMDTVTQKTGASGEALEGMQQSVKNIAQSIPTDYQTAADAVGEVNTRFGLTGDALEDLSTRFVEFADLNDTDVSTSVDKVQSAMEAWGVKAEDAGLVLDTFNKAGQDTGISVDKLSDMLKTNKTALDEMGFSMSDSAMFLANLDKNGVDAGTAIAGLKKSLQNAAKDGKSSADVMGELQSAMGEGASKSDAYAAAIEVFGAKAGPAIADAVQEGRLSFDELGTSLEDYAGNVEGTFNETLDPMDEMQTTMNTLKDLGAEIVESAAPMITEAMTAIRDIIVELKEKWDGLDESQQQNILKVAGIAAVIGPVVVAIGGVISVIGGIISAIGAVSGVLGGLFGAGGIIATIGPAIGGVVAAAAPLLPAGAIVLGIGVVAGAIITHWDDIKKGAGVLADGAKAAWDRLGRETAELVDGAKEKWTDFKNDTAQKFTDIKNAASEKITALKNGVTEKVESLKNAAVEKFESLKNSASEKFESLKSAASDKWTSIKDTISNAVSGIKDGASEKFDSFKEKASSIFESFRSSADEKMGGSETIVSNAVSAMLRSVGFTWGLPDLSTDTLDSAKNLVSDAIDAIEGFFDNARFEFPHIKLPHFSWEWVDVGGVVSIPSISIDWYAKAYSTPYMFTKPTVLSAMGFGDGSGGEMVYGHDALMRDIKQAMGDTPRTFAPTINIYTQEGQSNEEIARYVIDRLQREYDRAGRAFA